jgi:CheY-like chemotaxis protein
MKTKVMVIEDSYTNRILFKAILEDCGMEVLELSSAVKALEVMITEQPDMILLDMCMPVMTGFEFLRIFRLTDATTPVLVVSALDGLEYQAQAFALGANEYMVKPISCEELIRQMSGYIKYEVDTEQVEMGIFRH